jgi:hypothetical protein
VQRIGQLLRRIARLPAVHFVPRAARGAGSREAGRRARVAGCTGPGGESRRTKNALYYRRRQIGDGGAHFSQLAAPQSRLLRARRIAVWRHARTTAAAADDAATAVEAVAPEEAPHHALHAAAALHAAGRSLAARAALAGVERDALSAEHRALFDDVAAVASQTDDALAELDADEQAAGWLPGLEADSGAQPLRVLYHHVPGTTVHSLKLEGAVPASLLHVLAIAREFDLVSTWVRFFSDTCVLEAPSLLRVTVYAGLWVPYPLTDRDFCVAVRGVDALDEHGCLLIRFASAEQPLDALPPAAADRVRMLFRRACLRLTPLPNGGSRFTLVVHIDPRMPGDIEVPTMAVTWALRVLCPFIFSAACRVLKRLGEPGCAYTERMAANEALYGLVRAREAEARARLPPAVEEEVVEEAVPRRYMPAFLAAAGW